MTLQQAAEVIDVPLSTVSRWVQQRMVRPPGYVGQQRVPVNITPKCLGELAVIAQLRRAGVSFQHLREAADYLRGLGHNPFSTGKWAVLDHGRKLVKICDRGGAIEVLDQPGQMVMRLEEPTLEQS